MTGQIEKSHFIEAFLFVLEETFERVQGVYLDRGTSVFETLATLSAEQASTAVTADCATIAAHVAHTAYYIEMSLLFIAGDNPEADWHEIWQTVSVVSEAEWQASQQRLRAAYQAIQAIAHTTPWEGRDQIGGALGLLTHTAYHLGEIRQMLCHLRNR